MGDQNTRARAAAAAVEDGQINNEERGQGGGGYKPPSPRDLARVSDFRVARGSVEDRAQPVVDFDEDSFLNEALEGDETCIASSEAIRHDDFLADEEATRLSQTGVRRTLRPRQEGPVDFDDFDIDEFEQETRLSDRDLFAGPTCRPQPLEKKTG